ncbi:MAG: hypothetical protein ABI835_07835 [Chloroflexota bacterium]
MLKRTLVTMLLLVGVTASAAQDDIDPALAEQMTNLETITENLRNLPATEAVDHQFPTRQETIDYLSATYSRDFPPEEFDRLERFYVALDLLPADIDLQDVYLTLLGSQVAGYYDPDTKTMNVLPVVGDDPGTSLSLTEQIIYIHEFTHALQDQHFDLNALLEAPDVLGNPDRSLALTALVEGDATAVMSLYTQEVARRNPLAALSMLVEGLQAGNLFLPEGIPPILVDELLFPYNGGLDFVIALSQEGGWESVNAAYANPPTTSEQILHPEKYLAGESAQTVMLEDAASALGDGWQADWDTSLGEFYLREYLDTQLTSSESLHAAQGWGGDHFRVYHNASGEIAFALRIVWDSFADSADFNNLYAKYANSRFDGSMNDDGCWQNATSILCLVLTSETPESLIVSAPTVEQALALRDAAF